MAAQADLKSAAITNLDASPVVRPTAGREGGSSILYDVVGIAGPTTDGATTGGVLRMVRVPPNAILRDIMYMQEAATTTATFDCGAYYGSGLDTPANNRSNVIDADFFATGVNTNAQVSWASIMTEATTVTLADTVLPLWQALGLTENPGGSIDITLTNKATISGAATIGLRVQYVIAGDNN